MALFRKLFSSDQKEPDDVFLGLRAQAMHVKPADLGIGVDEAAPIFGVLMETGYEAGSATFLCLADGTVSLYTSTGGGVIGSGEHEAVRAACLEMLSWTNQYANEFLAAGQPAREYPLPGVGRVFFYLLSTHGVYLAKCSEARLTSDRDPFSDLFKSCHMVLAKAREETESQQTGE